MKIEWTRQINQKPLDAFYNRLIRNTASATSQVLAKTQAECPVASGALKASGEAGVALNGVRIEGTIAYTAPYAIDVEFGTKYIEPNPFFTKGINNAKGDIHRELRKTTAIEDVVTTAGQMVSNDNKSIEITGSLSKARLV